MRATIHDVAEASGVHISTVSRTFSAPHLVKEETRHRVLLTADSLGYRPNRAASSLITGKTHNIALIVADIANPFFAPMIKAAESQARLRDYNIFVAETDEDPGVEEDLARALAKQVDGVQLCSPRMSNVQIEKLSQEMPVVVVNRLVTGLPCVLMDVASGARSALEHLAGLGHRDIALLGGPRGSWTSREIGRSAAAAARRLGVTLTVLGPNPPTVEGGYASAERAVREGVTAVLAYNDLVAIGLIEGLEAQQVVVPTDVSVVGIDNIEMAQRIRPKLTTVANPTSAAGRTAVDMLLQLGDDRTTTAQVTLQTELIVRDSTGPGPHAKEQSATEGRGRRRGRRRTEMRKM
ncbi:MAG: LacI family DNA-binding transcriptional regulator [Streptosporangiales bacterium]|nr:LacI family DNA-binding transcriptional regulator [Streptosporangiales bacterium]